MDLRRGHVPKFDDNEGPSWYNEVSLVAAIYIELGCMQIAGEARGSKRDRRRMNIGISRRFLPLPIFTARAWGWGVSLSLGSPCPRQSSEGGITSLGTGTRACP